MYMFVYIRVVNWTFTLLASNAEFANTSKLVVIWLWFD